MFRHKIGEKENEFIARIRDNELRMPAPFSKNKLLILDSSDTLAEFPDTARPDPSSYVHAVEDVPILAIRGMAIPTHLDNYVYGMSFHDVLFMCLHGVTLIQESLDYLLSDYIKAHSLRAHGDFKAFPQNDLLKGSSAQSRGGVGFVKRKGSYFVEQGQQRTIMAMFWIYQNHGPNGLFKKVDVNRCELA